MKTYYDNQYCFFEVFDESSGSYIRSNNNNNEEPFMRKFPSMLDIGIMAKCVCAPFCNVDCYQKAIDRNGNNMSIEDYESILKQCKDKVFQVALGGAGDVDTHENFEKILQLTREYGIVPNFTTSGIALTKDKAKLCKKYCGAVAVSEHNAKYTTTAINMLLNENVVTNIHYVLSERTIDDAINRLENGLFPNGINAVIFLLYKPIGLGKKENILTNVSKIKRFFDLINTKTFNFKIGFDSCSSSGIISYTDSIDMNSIDYCESGRFSMYIDADMNAMPCSFANQNSKYFVSLREHTIEEAWFSDIFEQFRHRLKNNCPKCMYNKICSPCPICNISLCNSEDKIFI